MQLTERIITCFWENSYHNKYVNQKSVIYIQILFSFFFNLVPCSRYRIVYIDFFFMFLNCSFINQELFNVLTHSVFCPHKYAVLQGACRSFFRHINIVKIIFNSEFMIMLQFH